MRAHRSRARSSSLKSDIKSLVELGTASVHRMSQLLGPDVPSPVERLSLMGPAPSEAPSAPGGLDRCMPPSNPCGAWSVVGHLRTVDHRQLDPIRTHEFLCLIGRLRLYRQAQRSRKTNSISDSSLRFALMILFQGATETIALGAIRLSISRAGK